MDEELIACIREHISELFELPVYDDTEYAVSEDECFFLELVKVMQREELAPWYHEIYQFDLMYFPEGRTPKQDCRDMAMPLRRAVRFIPSHKDHDYKAYDIESNITADVLHVLFKIGIWLEPEQEETGGFIDEVTLRGELNGIPIREDKTS